MKRFRWEVFKDISVESGRALARVGRLGGGRPLGSTRRRCPADGERTRAASPGKQQKHTTQNDRTITQILWIYTAYLGRKEKQLRTAKCECNFKKRQWPRRSSPRAGRPRRSSTRCWRPDWRPAHPNGSQVSRQAVERNEKEMTKLQGWLFWLIYINRNNHIGKWKGKEQGEF